MDKVPPLLAPEVAAAVLAIVRRHLPQQDSDKETSIARLEDLGGSARSKVYRFLAVRAGRSWSMVLKAPVERAVAAGPEWTDRTARLGNEVATLRFLGEELGGAEAGRMVVPRLVGADLEAGLIVLEEIAPIRGRLDGLMWGKIKAQGGVMAAVQQLAGVALARIHGASAGAERLKRYAAVRDATGCKSKPAPDAAASVAGLTEMADGLQLAYNRDAFAREMQTCFVSSFASDGDFSSLIHADLCPDNVMVLNKRGEVCVLDFEFSRPGNALMDVSFVRLGFPTCWCAGPLARPIVRAAERAYRAAVVEAMPAVRDTQKWRLAMAQCCALWTWGFVRSSLAKDTLASDAPMSRKNPASPTRRQMIMFRLQVTAKALGKAGESLRNVHEATVALRAKLAALWPDLPPPTLIN
jgi:hypothetical protein